MYNESSEATNRIAIDYVGPVQTLSDGTPPWTLLYKKTENSILSLLLSCSINPDRCPSIMPRIKLSTAEQYSTLCSTGLKGRALLSSQGQCPLSVSVQDGTFLVAIDAKRRELFSTAETQLLTYLAILRKQQKSAGKINAVIQGFYTNGYRYCFMTINTEGIVDASRTFNIHNPRCEGLSPTAWWSLSLPQPKGTNRWLVGHRSQRTIYTCLDQGPDTQDTKTVFNFIIAILESAIKSSPNVSPTKPTARQEKEVSNYREEVWDRIYLSGVGTQISAWPRKSSWSCGKCQISPISQFS
jgi:hypothetical protein